MAGSGDRQARREGSARESQYTGREARRSEPALSAAATQSGRTSAGSRPSRGSTGAVAEQGGGSQASTAPPQRTIQRGRTSGTQSARNGLRSVGASMVVGKVNSVGALAGPSPRGSTIATSSSTAAAPSAPSRVPLDSASNTQAGRKLSSRSSQGAAAAQGPLPTLLTSSARRPSVDGCSGAGKASLAAAATREVVKAEEALKIIFDGDVRDAQKAGEYAADIHARALERETLLLPRPDYMDGQTDINAKMRSILIDWLVEVHMKYNLRPETLFLTVNIIDRYLCVKPVGRKKLQLLGVVAMLIASKFEEIDPPRVHEFAYITDNTYSKQDIMNMEAQVLAALGFQIAVPTAAHFLDRLQRANGCDSQHRCLAQYALELSLLDLRALRYPPSTLVAASLLLSNAILGRQPRWPPAVAHSSRRSEASLLACAEELRTLMEGAKAASIQAVRRKFQLDNRHAVANLVPPGPGILWPQGGGIAA